MGSPQFLKPEQALALLAKPKIPSDKAHLVLRRIGRVYETIQRIAAHRQTHPVAAGKRLAGELLKQFGSDSQLIGRFGENEVLARIALAIRFVRLEMRTLIDDVVPPDLMSDVSFHNDVAVQSNPAILMSYVLADDHGISGDHQVEREHLRSRHARTMLVLGILGFLLEAVDEVGWIEQDLRELSDAVRYDAQMSNVHVVTGIATNGTIEIVPESVNVFAGEESPEAYVQELNARGLRVYRADLLCREATVEGDTFFIFTNARPKELFAKIIKTLRGRSDPKGYLRDSRGVKDVVVAVRSEGVLRPATRADVRRWESVVRTQVFALPGVSPETIEKPEGMKATHSGGKHWDRKIYGRIVRDRLDEYRVGGRFEWLMQPIADHLHDLLSVSDDHHDVYVMGRFWSDFLPAAFPHRTWGQKGSEEYARVMKHWLRIVEARLSS